MISPGRRLTDVHSDFGRLWGSYAVSAAGSAVSAGALPLVAVAALHVSTFQVSLLAALSAVASAAISLPLGGRIEHRHKRPAMTTADGVRCLALASVPVAAALGLLTFMQLCVVGVLQSTAAIAFSAASTAHLKGLVAPSDRLRAAAQFETTDWISQSVGPPTGGLLIGVFGATATLAVDALSFLLSALGVRQIRRPEPAPPARTKSRGRARELMTGWRYILGHRGLRPLFWNAMLFGGSIMMSSPLVAVLMLRDLHFTPWQYGLALGLPCLGGVLGSRLTATLTSRLGPHRVLLLFGVLRTPWTILLPWLPFGTLGLVALVAADTGLLVAAGVFNPSFATYRITATQDHVMARVVTAWSVSSKTAQPLFIVAGGIIAAYAGVRTAILVAGTLCLASALLLPWSGLPSPALEESSAKSAGSTATA
ncbi:MFS transporter [Streptomyces sp. NBC_01262]|uniref:MFS transporter n=1 Tax=Streptomyces sp. NBC_01262 TaxID=2903803 RepID=UPI002E33406B|nr:MFS transporter [Streptomyces sp. NBC_01262]